MTEGAKYIIPNLPECRKPLVSGLYQFDHIQDRQFQGDDALDNWQALCTKPCHRDKTTRAKKAASHADRIRYGRAQPSAPFPGSRRSGWKANMDGTWERR